MSFLKNIFGNAILKSVDKEQFINWIPLNSLDQLAAIKKQSKTEVIGIFKHSTRCGISRSVLRQFENSFDESMSGLKIYYLDLLNFREISNEVSHQFQVVHQSPQFLVIRNEETVTHASHYDIMSIDLKQFI